MTKISDFIRINFKKNDDIRDSGLTTPDDVQRYDDIVYGSDPKWQVLDVYRPKDRDGETLPVIVSVHGGGWVYGDKERYQYYCMSLAQHGFAVVNYTYRLAPEFKFPAPLEDTNLVFSWILDHADQYHFDPHHIFAVGDSAGAHQLALYCAICTNIEYAAHFPFEVPSGFVPSAIALNCGAYQIDVKNNEQDRGLMAEYLPLGGTDEEIEMITVPNHITGDFPQTFLMSAEKDFLLGQVPVIATKFTEKGVPFEYHFYVSKEEELGHVFHCNMKSDAAHKCNRDECDFFKKTIETVGD